VIARRSVLAAAGAALGSPASLQAQVAGRVYRLAILRPSRPAPTTPALVDALRKLGYVEGRNLTIDSRFASGQLERLPELARELVQGRPDVLLAVSTAAVRAARAATTAVPVLMFGNLDPVAQGLVANLARPEANVTGVLIAADGTLGGKRLELLREAVPRASRVAVLAPDDPNFGLQLDETRRAAAVLKLGLEVTTVHARDYPAAFAALAARRPDALVVGAHSFFMEDRKPIIELAARHRLPAVYEWPEQVRDGGLLAYGTNLDALYARLADYAAQLFAGRKASDLPVERPSAYRLVVNRRTASALGLTLSPALLLRADEVIE
jgi:putative ABC transport system substrate-binding protein